MNVQHHEWGGAMNRDVLEQVRNLIDEKIADPTRIAVFGGSYLPQLPEKRCNDAMKADDLAAERAFLFTIS